MSTLVYSSSLAAAFLGGMLALFAPCCIVSLLPAYLASALRRGAWRLTGLTVLFAVGLAAVLLPVVLGVGALGQLIAQAHLAVDLIVGVFLITLGVIALRGQGWLLPLPMFNRPLSVEQGNAGSMVLVGMASGVASSCCAPVLAGVLALTALTPSLLTALTLGLAYVFGMVVPLFLAAILWERLGLSNRSVARLGTYRIQRGIWSVRLTDALSGVMFLVMGGVALALAALGQATYTPDVLYQFDQSATGLVARWVAGLQGIPMALQGLALLLLVGLIAWFVVRPLEKHKTSEGKDLSSGAPSVSLSVRGENCHSARHAGITQTAERDRVKPRG